MNAVFNEQLFGLKYFVAFIEWKDPASEIEQMPINTGAVNATCMKQGLG